jgi:hypothetical protein
MCSPLRDIKVNKDEYQKIIDRFSDLVKCWDKEENINYLVVEEILDGLKFLRKKPNFGEKKIQIPY